MKTPQNSTAKARHLWPILLPLSAIAGMAIFLGIVHLLGDQAPKCMLHEWTGYHCPGCGGTRCARALASGDISQALGYNAMLTVAAAFSGLISLFLVIRVTLLNLPAPNLTNIPPIWFKIALAIVILFTILRNLPMFVWLAP